MKDRNLSRDLHLAYTLLEFLTPARLRVLREMYSTPDAIARAETKELSNLLRVPEEKAALVKDPLHVPAIREQVSRARDRAVTIDDREYPDLLRQIVDPPAALYCDGDRGLLARPAIGIVGSRRASRYGLAVAEKLAGDLSTLGITVISGLARGIDQAAHRGALGHEGSTIGVLGTGIEVDYPRGSGTLRRRIRERGLIVTELPPGTPPRPHHFPIRNRIISGLSLGILIVEATDRSGSLITARLAAEQDREVFASPGSIFGKGSEGPHRLIQYGAKLVHDVDDILDELQVQVHRPSLEREPPAVPSPLAGRILQRLEPDGPTHADTLAAELAVGIGELSSALLELELEGHIRAVPGGNWVRNPRGR